MKHSWQMFSSCLEEKRETCGFRCEHCDETVTEVRFRNYRDGEWGKWDETREMVDLTEDCPHNNRKVKEDIVRAHVKDMCRTLRDQQLDLNVLSGELERTKELLAKRGIYVKFSADHLEAGATGFAGIITFDIIDPPEEAASEKSQDP